jgi:PIN domain nuclease of toxin-antitoxin system
VNILLDTHVWIWSQESPQSLGPTAREAIADEDNDLFVSPVSSLELARLAWGGRLTLTGRLQTWIAESMNALLADTAPFTHDVALAAYDLPGEFHRDPADRVLAATAMVNDLTLVSADERILTYEHLLSLDARA